MINDSIFNDLLDAFNFGEDEMQELDFSKKENVDKIVEIVNTLKTSDSPLHKLALAMIGEDTLNEIVEYAQQEYAKSHVDDEVKATKNLPAKVVPERPSEKTSTKHKEQISKLAAEYLDTMIKPYTSLTDEAYDNIHDGLIEFACWLMNK